MKRQLVMLLGVEIEPCIQLVYEALRTVGAKTVMANQTQSARWALHLEGPGQEYGTLRLDEECIDLEEVSAAYERLMHYVPLLKVDGNIELLSTLADMYEDLYLWLQYMPGKVVNRRSAMSSNSSKPYQLQLISDAGFQIPRTIVTNDPDAALRFIEEVGPAVYKSISHRRSIVQRFRSDDVDRLTLIRWCPTQFQEYVPGENLRVHVIGDEVIATRIVTEAVDYRYAGRTGNEIAMVPAKLDKQLTRMCLDLAKSLNLPLAGIDLRLREDEVPVCLEVNPMPAFSYYECRTHQPIAATVASYLTSRDS
jgi:hypothetical protein